MSFDSLNHSCDAIHKATDEPPSSPPSATTTFLLHIIPATRTEEAETTKKLSRFQLSWTMYVSANQIQQHNKNGYILPLHWNGLCAPCRSYCNTKVTRRKLSLADFYSLVLDRFQEITSSPGKFPTSINTLSSDRSNGDQGRTQRASTLVASSSAFNSSSPGSRP
ncbi:hypothetical protein ACFE04_013256 [Oxalis oulophora]